MANLPRAPGQQQATRPAEWAAAIGGGLALAGILVWLLRGPFWAEAPTPAATAGQQPNSMFSATTVSAAPPPSPSPPPAMPTGAAARAPPAIILRGIIQRPDGAAAILEIGGGRQRLVRQGGEVAPGSRLVQIGGASIEIETGGTRQTIAFPGTAAVPVSGADAGAARSVGTVSDYRLGFSPRRRDGRIDGYRADDLSRLPALRAAGLQPGDVLLAVNGQPLFSDEKLMEVPAEIAASPAFEIRYERQGREQTARSSSRTAR